MPPLMGVQKITSSPGSGNCRGDATRLARIGPRLAVACLALAGLFVASTEIIDADFGRHLAFGRILLSDFGSVRHLTMGQGPEILHQAYSYWLYQVILAGLHDGLGPATVVVARVILLAAAFAGAFILALRWGSTMESAASALLLALALSHERFLDRPELFSFVFWTIALGLLIFHREERRIWLLVPLQILWVNTHLWFGLLPGMVAAFAAGDLLEKRGGLRRGVLLLGAVLLATMVNPHGPAAWRSQFYLAQFLGRNYSLPFQIGEMMGPFTDYQTTLAVWVFRIAMPLILVSAIVGRKRVGWGAVFVLALAAILGARARRGIPLFALSSLVIIPILIDEARRRLPRAADRAAAALLVLVPILCGVAAAYGALSQRLFLAQDLDSRIGFRMSPRFAALDASRFLREQRIDGPIFHHPLAAGAIVMENGSRLSPFLDARWIGTPETIDAYQRLRTAGEETIGTIWRGIQGRYGFETVVLDFYEMPALLRHLSIDNPEWATVYVEPTAAVLCRRDGANRDAIRRLEGPLLLARLGPDAERERALGAEVLRVLRGGAPGVLEPARFPFEPFFRANYAVLLRYRYDAQAAYLDLLRSEGGTLRMSPHRIDVLNNLFWCLMESREVDAVDALAETLCGDRAVPDGQRRSIRLHQARAMEASGRNGRAEELARGIVSDRGAAPQDRWAAWCRIASLRTRTEDYAGVAEALSMAVKEMPSSAETYRSLGVVLDLKLDRPAEALEAYGKFRALGGREAFIEERIAALAPAPAAP